MGISSYSTTPASNTTISGINIAEGCAPSGINDAIRQMMADIATDVRPQQLPTATGTANAVVVTLSPALTSYSAGQRFQFLPILDNTGATTINYAGSVINLQKRGGIVLAAKDIVAGVVADIEHDGTRAILLNPQQYTHGADIASAATLNLDNATGDYVYVTGTTGITAITLAEGRQVTTKFTGVLTITNGASLICPGGTNFTSAANDVITWRGEASGVVRAVHGLKADGSAFIAAGTTDINSGTTGTLNVNRGGTGSTSLTANNVLLGNGTSALQAVAPGTSGNVLTSNGTTWQSSAPPVVPAQASTGEVAAQSAVTKYVSPDRIKNSPLVPKAVAEIDNAGAGGTLVYGQNISSISDIAGGSQINFTTAMSTSSYFALIEFTDSSGSYLTHTVTKATGNIQISNATGARKIRVIIFEG